MGNGAAGVAIIDGATGNTIGGTAAGSGNVISANAGDGVDDIDANSNVIVGNWIGTNAVGTAVLANSGDGMFVGGSSSVVIGGTVEGAGNLISGNAANGVEIDDSTGTLDSGQPDRARPDRNARPRQPRGGHPDQRWFRVQYDRRTRGRGA